MGASYAVTWLMHGRTHSGSLALEGGRLVLAGRDHTLSIPLGSISAATIERGREARISGLPSLVVRLPDGDQVQIASLAGAGSLLDLVAALESAHASVGRGV